MFQHQQKGLFTFYREQQLFQDQIKKKKQKGIDHSPRELKKDKKVKKELLERSSHLTEKVISQPIPAEDPIIQTPQQTQFKRYGGDAVAIFKRKNTQNIESSKKKEEQPVPKQQLGTYLQNKNMSFLSPQKEQEAPVTTHRKKSLPKRIQKMVSSHSRPRQPTQNYTKLPSIAKVDQQQDMRSPSGLKNKINGSLIKSNGSELLRQIRNRAVVQESLTEQQRSVSYFQFSREYRMGSQTKRKGNLSTQQRKLLQILGRYRRCD